MVRNIGNIDRIARAVAVVPLTACSFMAPFPVVTRLIAFALPALYMAFTVLRGTCLGYLMMGKSTCPVASARKQPQTE
jgi:hypothetical protein